MTVMVVDGQGGKIGKQLIEGLKKSLKNAELRAVGTNAAATATMMKAGADCGASGENAVLVGSRAADVIVGPIGIVIADAMLGEITPAMAAAIGASAAQKVLLPINRCNNNIVGVKDLSVAGLIGEAIEAIEGIAQKIVDSE